MQRSAPRKASIPSRHMGPCDRAGFTLLELMVVLAIVGLLLAILLPAVQRSRATAGRLQCLNNLKQLGMGLHLHEESHGQFPARATSRTSFLVSVLPYVEQKSLYDRMKFKGGLLEVLEHNNQIRLQHDVPLFHCPSDGASGIGSTNYLGNGGTGFPDGENGFFAVEPRSTGDFPGGLSNVVSISESLVVGEVSPTAPEATNGTYLIAADPSTPAAWASFVSACEIGKGQRLPFGLGENWTQPGPPATIYNHVLNPNANSCNATDGNNSMGIYTSSSHHSNGVNVVRGDGSAGFVSSQVDRDIWHRLGAVDR